MLDRQRSASLPEIRLRAMEPEDLDLLYTIENNADLWKVGTANVPYSRYILHDYIATSTGDIYTDKQVRLVIETAEGVTVGLVDVLNFDPHHQRAELGIVVINKFRGRGYAASALTTVINYAVEIWHLHQLYAIIGVDNQDSLQLFKSLEFRQGILLDDWLYDGKGYRPAVIMQKIL